MSRVAVPALVMPIGTVIFIVLAPALSSRYGVLGITSSSSFVSAVVFALMLFLLARRVKELKGARIAVQVLQYAGLAGVCFALPAAFGVFELPKIAAAVVSFCAGSSLYLLCLLVLKDPVLAFLRRFVREAMPARRTAGSLFL
jgi:hypothetical protein